MRGDVRQQNPTSKHDSWFRAKVREGLTDARPPLEHDQVVKRARAIIDHIAASKKHGRDRQQLP
jgi:hypothetical protein